MATLALRLDRTKGIATVVSQDRVYIRDESVAVTVEGFADGEESLAPCLQVLHGRFAVAEAMLEIAPPNDDGDIVATASLDTNTRQLVGVFCGCANDTMHQFQFRIFATTSQKPIAVGICSIWNFNGGCGEPSNLPSASEVLAELREDLDDHVADRDNPHAVTKAQIGLGNADNTSDEDKPIGAATRAALANLSNTLGGRISTETAQRQAADDVLQLQIDTNATAIGGNREAAMTAIDAEARTRANADASLNRKIDAKADESRAAINEEKARAQAAEATIAQNVNALSDAVSAFKAKFDFSTISELTDADSLRAVKNAFNNLLQKLKAVNQ